MRRTWKKLATLLLAGTVLVSTTACGGGETSGKQKDTEQGIKSIKLGKYGGRKDCQRSNCKIQ